jgi:aspartate/tyrosine/aromatic aminotransferase
MVVSLFCPRAFGLTDGPEKVESPVCGASRRGRLLFPAAAKTELSMFEKIEMAPPDPILGLNESFAAEKNPQKINLGVGVFKDAQGTTPILATVRAAETRLLEREKSKNYLGIAGLPEFAAGVQGLLFGEGHDIIGHGRAATAQTPGGTGALRVAGDFIKNNLAAATIWVSEPTWENHKNVFIAAGLKVAGYPYYDAKSRGLDFDAMKRALAAVPAGDVVLLHACCHNPTGIDPTAEQWEELAQVAQRAGFMPLFDFAYQGFGDGLQEDAAGLRAFCAKVKEMLIASSFSKNFGLYNERVGALTVLAADRDGAQRALSQVKRCIRANYSNPPAHGASAVATILGDAALRSQWETEVTQMRGRINGMRKLFVQTLAAKGVKQDFSFILRQRGMFSYSGLTKDQVRTLRDKYAIYMVDSGRINVAGMTEQNMDRLCTAIAEVLKG